MRFVVAFAAPVVPASAVAFQALARAFVVFFVSAAAPDSPSAFVRARDARVFSCAIAASLRTRLR